MKRYTLFLSLTFAFVVGLRVLYQGRGLNLLWQKEKFWLEKANTQETYDILVLGDSRTFFAVDPDLLKKNHEQSALNFSFPTISFTKHYLEKAGQRLSPKAHVYIGLTAEALTDFNTDLGFRSSEKKGPLLLNYGTSWVRVYWPTFNFINLIKYGRLSLNKVPPEIDQDTYHTNGWVESNHLPTKDSREMANSYRDLFVKHKVKNDIIHNLEQHIKTWTQDGITVTAFWACFDKLVCAEEQVPLANGVRELINQKLEISGARMLKLETESFITIDGDHLTGPEAIKFSRTLHNQTH